MQGLERMAARMLLLARTFQVIEKPVLRLMISIGVPIASALVLEQLPKTGVADVPFAFQVEERMLPAGTYSVSQANMGRGVKIQNQNVASEGLKCVAARHKFGKAQAARLVFDRCDGRYLLSEIWFDAEGRGLVLQQKPLGENAGSKAEQRDIRYVTFH
jgi:hypothetical protein